MEDNQIDDQLEEAPLNENPRYVRPKIFDRGWQENIPPSFDAITISLNGRTQADLDWSLARDQALQAISKGFGIMWDMQLGLFKDLVRPIDQQTQFLSLALSLEHFRDSLWKEFKSHTLGLVLYRGSADFSEGFCWDDHQIQNLQQWLKDTVGEELASLDLAQLESHTLGSQLVKLYCRDASIEYLGLLASRLPDALFVYLYLDATFGAKFSMNHLQLLNPDRFERFHLALKGTDLRLNAIGWQYPSPYGYVGHSFAELSIPQKESIGVCVPSINNIYPAPYQKLEQAIACLQNYRLPFKLISENQLNAQWDGIDYILYASSGLSIQGKRKLLGFCAAGGIPVTVDEFSDLPHEISLNDLLNFEIVI